MILDGKKVRDTILDNVKKEIEENNLKLKLAIILVGNNSASEVYIRNKVNNSAFIKGSVKASCAHFFITVNGLGSINNNNLLS